MNRWLLIPALLVLLLIGWTATTQITKETILSEAQISSRVETFYNGTVGNHVKKGDQYFVTFTTANGIYEIAVDEDNGRFSQLTLIKEIHAQVEEKPPVAPPVVLTKEQARIIAQKQYMGEIEVITFRDTADGGYYLVEIDAEENVTLQIHAVTGQILSVSFED